MDRKQFDIQVKETEESNVIYLEGELDLAVAARFRSTIEQLIPSQKAIILNLQDLTYIDSTGMGIIIFLLKARAEDGKGFAVEDIPLKIKRLFDLTGITKFIPVNDQPQIEKADDM